MTTRSRFSRPTSRFDDPLALPDDDAAHGLWELRSRLLDVAGADEDGADEDEADEDGNDEDGESWSWDRIAASLAADFGYDPSGPDPLTALGEHFFPAALEVDGPAVPADRRLFTVALAAADTTPAMWNSLPAGPFWYDAVGETLSTRLPLSDAKVTEKLSSIRALGPEERAAVRELYWAPRAMLARFGLVFENQAATAELLIQEPDEAARFSMFAREYARFYKKAGIIAAHLADHIGAIAPQPGGAITAAEAWRLLRSTYGDENGGTGPWEDDSGKPPGVLWPDPPTGGAFAALLGVTGTGLVGELSSTSADPAWREMRGPLTMFGEARNEWNAPVPTVIPALDLTFTAEQLEQAAVRNGFGLRDLDGEPLYGAQPFEARWSGTLLVEQAGDYEFAAGAPTPDGEAPDHEHCPEHRWRITIRRGRKSWQLLNRGWPDEDAPDHRSGSLELRRGAYQLVVELAHDEPTFADQTRSSLATLGSSSSTKGRTPTATCSRYRTGGSTATRSTEPFGDGHRGHRERSGIPARPFTPAACATSGVPTSEPSRPHCSPTASGCQPIRCRATPSPSWAICSTMPRPSAGQTYFRTGANTFGVASRLVRPGSAPRRRQLPLTHRGRRPARRPQSTQAGRAVRLVGAPLRLRVSPRARRRPPVSARPGDSSTRPPSDSRTTRRSWCATSASTSGTRPLC